MPALLSRFDLVFILIDSPDEAHDKMMSEHIFALHKAQGVKRSRLSSTACNHSILLSFFLKFPHRFSIIIWELFEQT